MKHFTLFYIYRIGSLHPRCAFVGNRVGAQVITLLLLIALPLTDGLRCTKPKAMLPVHILVHGVYALWLLCCAVSYADQAATYVRRMRRCEKLKVTSKKCYSPLKISSFKRKTKRQYYSASYSGKIT